MLFLTRIKSSMNALWRLGRKSGSCGFCLCYLTCIEVLLACELYEQDERTVPLSGNRPSVWFEKIRVTFRGSSCFFAVVHLVFTLSL